VSATPAPKIAAEPTEERAGQPAIHTRQLTKRFGAVTALDHVNLSVAEGTRLGLLGPNGSGKSTLVRILLGLVYATSGDVELLGLAMPKHARVVLSHVGALIESPAAYRHLSGRANLLLMDAAGPYGSRHDRRARVEQALTTVGLAGVGRRRVRAYSLGMRQRLGLAGTLLRSPQLLLLDEPTNGLDPQGIHELRELLQTVNAAGTTVVLSSHLLTEVEALCTEVAVLDSGRLVVHCPLDELRRPTGRIVMWISDVARCQQILGDQVVEVHDDRLVVRSEEPAAVNAVLVNAGIEVHEMTIQRQSLEDVVIALTAHGSDRVAG
jgi:ABC-type multidrug transport system ATPase subunit